MIPSGADPHHHGRGEIAQRMMISPFTAKTHVNRAMTKLHCRDRAQLVVGANESGLTAPRRRKAGDELSRPHPSYLRRGHDEAEG